MKTFLRPGPAACTVLILAGGQSRRMGRDKASLPFGAGTLLEHLIGLYGQVFGEVLVVAGTHLASPKLGVAVVRDEFENAGPLAGLEAGLAAAHYPHCFVSSCDHPFPNLKLIVELLGYLDRYWMVVPKWEGHIQPLFGAYRSAVASECKRLLADGERRPVSLLERTPSYVLEEAIIRRLDPKGWSLYDVDVPEDYARALERLGGLPGVSWVDP